MNREEVLEEVGFLLSSGMSAEAIAAKLPLKPGSIARSLQRCGEPELAKPFSAMARRQAPPRKCLDCPALINVRAQRCFPCSMLARSRNPEWIEHIREGAVTRWHG